MRSIFIRAGHTRKGFIAALAGFYPDVRFEYLPMTWPEKEQFFRAGSRQKTDDQGSHAAKELAKRLKCWDLTDEDGSRARIDDGHCASLPPLLFDRFLAVICGADIGDLDPTWTDEEKKRHLGTLADAAASKREPGEVAEEHQAGN
jgi:hypothetical protein